VYEAQKVGTQSLANQITAGARAFRRIYTPVQQQIGRLIRIILAIALYLELLLALAGALQSLRLVDSLQMAVVIIGLVPNGFLVAIATAYALAAMRMAGRGVLIQQANAVESMSHVDVLCLDKTGTLTANQLELEVARPIGITEAELRRSLGHFVASTPAGNRTTEAIGRAFPGEAYPVQAEVPFASERKWSALSFDVPDLRGGYVLGAPEILDAHLDGAYDPTQVTGWTALGLRVLLFAGAPAEAPLQDEDGGPALPNHLTPLGLLALRDALRPEAEATLRDFGAAGIDLKIISGDHPTTVAALARQAGFDAGGEVVSGTALEALDADAFAAVAAKGTVFGLITPRQKERLVGALRGQGRYVAMIGDGVNDVLSLKQANLGIAMHGGSQATRNVADMVLLKDSFAALPSAFSEGQRIRNGMQDIVQIFLTRILYVALLVLSIQIVGGFPFLPRQSALVALFAVGIPTIALAAWARPGAADRAGTSSRLVSFVLPGALVAALVGLGVYLLALANALQAETALNPALSDRAAWEGALPVAQSALTTFSIFYGLMLLLFLKPPTPLWTGAAPLSDDRRPAYLALALFIAYLIILAVPSFRGFFELRVLEPLVYLLIAAAVVLAGVLLRLVWRSNLLERLIGAPTGSGGSP
jgi:cation-transporting ATPase E